MHNEFIYAHFWNFICIPGFCLLCYLFTVWWYHQWIYVIHQIIAALLIPGEHTYRKWFFFSVFFFKMHNLKNNFSFSLPITWANITRQKKWLGLIWVTFKFDVKFKFSCLNNCALVSSGSKVSNFKAFSWIAEGDSGYK